MKIVVHTGFFLIFLIVLALVFSDGFKVSSFFRRTPETDYSAVLDRSYTQFYFTRQSLQKPVWEVYEISADDDTGIHEPVTITHQSGKIHHTLTFVREEKIVFRFTPDLNGQWRFSTGGDINLSHDRPAHAKGFVVADGGKWNRSATGQAFVPQYVMYDRPDIDAGIR
ncbi:MAG: hypothetical protein KFF46_01850, partial [Desulfobacterales bacterium]|nr:hypothetical protein [Desulfobacterales bacterium]